MSGGGGGEGGGVEGGGGWRMEDGRMDSKVFNISILGLDNSVKV